MNKRPIFVSKKLFEELLACGSGHQEHFWDHLNRRGGLIILLPNESTQGSESLAPSVKSNAANTPTEPTQR